MADVVSALNPVPFAPGASALFPGAQWQPVEITNADGIWHGWRFRIDGVTLVRAALVTPSAAYLTAIAPQQAAFVQFQTAQQNAGSEIAALRAAVLTAAQGGTALTAQQVARALLALGAR